MIFPKIKEAFINSEFYRRNNILPKNILDQYKFIKNHYFGTKNKLKNEIKCQLIQFVHNFIKCNVDDKYLENYVLDLIEEFSFFEFDKELNEMDEYLVQKIYNLNSIKLLIDVEITDKEFIYKHCSPEYYIKKNLNKNKLKTNYRMCRFLAKSMCYNKIIKQKLKLNEKFNIDKYLKYCSDNIDEYHIIASEYGNLKYLKFLVEKGADIHHKNDESLDLSCKYGHLEIVKYLVGKGADIHANNDSAIIHCAYNGHIDIIKFLIEKGADIDSNHVTIFENACINGRLDVIKFINEINPNFIIDINGLIVLACENGHLNIVKFLIENGIDIFFDKNYAIKMAIKNNHIEIIEFLLKYDIKYLTKLNFVMKCELYKFCKKFNIKI